MATRMNKEDLFSGKALAAVLKFETDTNTENKKAFWESDDAVPVRRQSKARYIKIQEKKCCYCKQLVKSSNFKMWEVEHILPRSNFPSFMVEPDNLSVSCPDCNTAKGNKTVSKSKSYARFPRKSNSYTIIHPHYDNYEDHIHHRGNVYMSKGPKGAKTIVTCNLFRYSENCIDWTSPVDISEVDEIISAVSSDPEKLKKIILFMAGL